MKFKAYTRAYSIAREGFDIFKKRQHRMKKDQIKTKIRAKIVKKNIQKIKKLFNCWTIALHQKRSRTGPVDFNVKMFCGVKNACALFHLLKRMSGSLRLFCSVSCIPNTQIYAHSVLYHISPPRTCMLILFCIMYSQHANISPHQNKKALSPFYYKKYFW